MPMPYCAAACGLLQIPPRPPRHATLTPPPKKAHPFPVAQIPTFPRSPSTRRRSVARTRAPRRLYLPPAARNSDAEPSLSLGLQQRWRKRGGGAAIVRGMSYGGSSSLAPGTLWCAVSGLRRLVGGGLR